jgi:hypothetical protein
MEKSTDDKSPGERVLGWPEWQEPPHWQPSRSGSFLRSLIYFMVPQQKVRNAIGVRGHAGLISKVNARKIRHALLVLKINSKPVSEPPEQVEF